MSLWDIRHEVRLLIENFTLIGLSFGSSCVNQADNFSYLDPVDSSLTKGQGLRILLEDGSRVILRLSGTGTKGATIRVYLEGYLAGKADLKLDLNP